MGVIILNTLDAGFKNSFINYKTFFNMAQSRSETNTFISCFNGPGPMTGKKVYDLYAHICE